jgi:glycosyltransferase involved in cell wall biosynthesis
MRIALNLGNLRGFGSRKVGQGVLAAWTEYHSHDHLRAWVPSSWDRSVEAVDAGLRVETVASGLVSKFIADNVSIRRHLCSGRADCLFSLGDTSMIGCGVPHLLLVQQAHLAYAPDQWGYTPAPAFRAKMAFMAAYLRAGLPTVSHVTVQTRSMKRRLCERFSLESERVTVVPSAIELETSARWTPKNETKPRPYILYVASAAPHKNFELLVPLMRALPPALSDVICRLTVRCEQVPELVERARQLGVLDRFEFLGAVTDIEPLIADASVFVMPSRLESFGLPYYEAMAIGCPLVVADRDFAREACGDAALYASFDSGEDFALKVAELIESTGRQRELSKRGRSRFEQTRTTWSDVVHSYRHILSRLIDEQ